MGIGVSFYEGCEMPSNGNQSTIPDQPKTSSGGPVESPIGLDSGSNFSNTSNSQATGGNPGNLGSKWSSPTDM